MTPVQKSAAAGYEMVKRNAFGFRWHIITKERVLFSANTKRAVLAYCRRHGIQPHPSPSKPESEK